MPWACVAVAPEEIPDRLRVEEGGLALQQPVGEVHVAGHDNDVYDQASFSESRGAPTPILVGMGLPSRRPEWGQQETRSLGRIFSPVYSCPVY